MFLKIWVSKNHNLKRQTLKKKLGVRTIRPKLGVFLLFLYSKRTVGYPLSPHRKTCVVYFLYMPSNESTKRCILKILKKHLTLGVRCAPPKYFSEFYKLYLGVYKSQFSGTTFVLVERCLLSVQALKKIQKISFVRVRHHRTLNVAIYMVIYHL